MPVFQNSNTRLFEYVTGRREERKREGWKREGGKKEGRKIEGR